jgi:hypothetical protein
MNPHIFDLLSWGLLKQFFAGSAKVFLSNVLSGQILAGCAKVSA